MKHNTSQPLTLTDKEFETVWSAARRANAGRIRVDRFGNVHLHGPLLDGGKMGWKDAGFWRDFVETQT